MYVTIRDEILLNTGVPDLHEGLSYFGLRGLEMRVTRDFAVHALMPTAAQPKLFLDRDADVDTLRRQTHNSGVRVSAFLLGNDFNAADKEKELSWMAHVVEVAGRLGIPAVRIDAIMTGQKELPLEQRQQLAADGIKQVLDRTPHAKVDLGIENHGPQGNDPAFLDGVLQKVGSRRLGLTMDVGNFYWAGNPLSRVYEIIEHFAPHAKHTHIKNIAYPVDQREIQRPVGWEYAKYDCPIAEGDLDMNRIVGILKKAGYDRDLCIEDESLGKYDEAARKEHIKGAIAVLRKAAER